MTWKTVSFFDYSPFNLISGLKLDWDLFFINLISVSLKVEFVLDCIQVVLSKISKHFNVQFLFYAYAV